MEVGSHPQLSGPIRQILNSSVSTKKEIAYNGTLDRKLGTEEPLLGNLRFLFRHGVPFDLGRADQSQQRETRPRRLVDLPPYPLDPEPAYWHESRLSKHYRRRQSLPHELLGSLSPDPNGLEPRWQHYLRVKDVP